MSSLNRKSEYLCQQANKYLNNDNSTDVYQIISVADRLKNVAKELEGNLFVCLIVYLFSIQKWRQQPGRILQRH